MDKKVILITVICSIVLFAGIFTLCGIAASKNNNSKGNVKNSESGIQTAGNGESNNIADKVETEKKPVSAGTYNDSLSLGDVVETKSVRLALKECAFTIACYDDRSDKANYLKPKRYEPGSDTEHISEEGKTLVYGYIEIEAIGRNEIRMFEPVDANILVSVNYNGNEYKYQFSGERTSFYHCNYAERKLENAYSFISLKPAEIAKTRFYFQIPTEVDNLNDTFYITFKLPDGQGEKVVTYKVN